MSFDETPKSTPPTRDRLLRAAIDIVARDGMAAATTAAIAQAANVAEGTLYRHFDSKDDLFVEAYRQMKAVVFLQAAASVDVSLTPAQRLKETWRAIFNAYRADPAAFVFSGRFAESPLAARDGGESARKIGRLVNDLWTTGSNAGVFKELPVDLLTALFLSPISYLLKAEMNGRRWSDGELDAAAEAVLAGWRR